MGFPPRRSIVLEEDRLAGRATFAGGFEEGDTVLGQNHVTRLPALALSDGNRSDIGVEIGNDQPRKLAIAGAGLQRGAHERTELRVASLKKPPALVHTEIARTGRVGALERV
jgi:hypothetical protein